MTFFGGLIFRGPDLFSRGGGLVIGGNFASQYILYYIYIILYLMNIIPYIHVYIILYLINKPIGLFSCVGVIFGRIFSVWGYFRGGLIFRSLR